MRPILLTVLLTVATACGAQRRQVTRADVDVARVADENNAFTLDMLRASREVAPGNAFLSPFSINAALSMVYAGARGETAEELREVLHAAEGADRHGPLGALLRDLSGDRRREYELHVGNRIWAQTGGDWRREFLDVTRDDYGAEAAIVDIAANPERVRGDINKWVATQTRDMIPELFSPGAITPSTALVLANAIYFKGTWEKPFEKRDTSPSPFELLDGSIVDVDRMHGVRTVPFAQAEGFRVVGLPYGESAEVRMWVVLPDEPGGLPEVEASLTRESLFGAFDRAIDVPVQVGFPRLTMTTRLEIRDALSDLGMPTAFSDRADFTGMREMGGIALSAVIHEAVVQIDEEGTVAAAATGVAINFSSAPATPIPFLVDRPYLFVIRDELTGAALFIGRVVDPRG
jgi:serpin B